MMPFRGSYFSHPGKDRKNIPTVIPQAQPTAPSFNMPSPVPYVAESPVTQTPEAPTAANMTPEVQTPPAKQPLMPQVMPSTAKAMQPAVPSQVPTAQHTPAFNPGSPMINMAPQIPQCMCTPSMYQPPLVQQPMIQQPMFQQPMVQPSCPYLNSQMMYGAGDMDLMNMNDTMDMTIRVPNADPPPVLSNNPAVPSVSLFKELTGYPNYGNPSGNADILYTGNRGVWTMDAAPFLFIPGNQRAQLIIRAVLDDHSNVPVSQYSLRITFNGNVVHNGPVRLEHGTPTGTQFNNWRSLTFNVSNLRRNNRIVIENTSSAGPNDWIAFDWMELRLAQR